MQRMTAQRQTWLVVGTATLVVAATGGALTEVGPWYRALAKPSWQPPDWLFGPAWTLIFSLTAIAIVAAWLRAPDAAARRLVVVLFVANAVLNMLWSLLFFTLHRPDWALLEVVALWLSILAPVLLVGRWAPRARLLLLPHLAWISFAAFLNLTIVRLNG